MKILVLSSQARNTGSNLRAFYIYKNLKGHNAETAYIEPPFKSMPFMFDFLLSLVYYFFALMNSRYDAVIIVKPYPNTVLPALMLKAKGARIIIDIDDLDYGYRGGILSAIIKKLQEAMIRTADLLTSHNSSLIKLIEADHPQFKGKIYSLKQCVDLEYFRVSAGLKKMAAGIRKGYNGKTILFYMAHLNIASYLEDIFSSIQGIKDENIVLVVAGGGPLLHYYMSMAEKMGMSERVVFLGQLTPGAAAAHALASDVCLVYYRAEPVNNFRASMKLREYIALGKRVIATNVGEIKIFKDFIFLSKPDPAAFGAVIKKGIKSLDKKGEKGYKFISDNYNWKSEAKKFLKYLLDGQKNGQ